MSNSLESAKNVFLPESAEMAFFRTSLLTGINYFALCNTVFYFTFSGCCAHNWIVLRHYFKFKALVFFFILFCPVTRKYTSLMDLAEIPAYPNRSFQGVIQILSSSGINRCMAGGFGEPPQRWVWQTRKNQWNQFIFNENTFFWSRYIEKDLSQTRHLFGCL